MLALVIKAHLTFFKLIEFIVSL